MSIWDEREEQYLRKLNLQCLNMYHYYNKQYLKLNEISKKFNIPIMILSAINSLLALTLASFINQQYTSIINAILSATVGILSSILLFLKINEKINISFLLSSKMNILALKISKELNISRSTRTIDGAIFLNECYNEYIQIIDKSYPLNQKIKNYLKIEDFINDLESITSSLSLQSVQLTPKKQKSFSFSNDNMEKVEKEEEEV